MKRMERTAPIAAMRYLTQSGIPIRCDVACAIDFVFLIAFAAHAARPKFQGREQIEK
jgi:hypothetical protein